MSIDAGSVVDHGGVGNEGSLEHSVTGDELHCLPRGSKSYGK